MTLKDEYLKRDGANQFLLAHCQRTLEEIQVGYRGVAHSVNRCNSEYATCWEAIKELRQRCDSLEKQQRDIEAAVGKLQEQVVQLEEIIEKARKAYAKLLKKHEETK